MLVIMKYRNIQFATQFLFYKKTARGGNILQVDSSKNRRKYFNRSDDLLDILCIQTYRKGIHAGKLLE